ncbi:MAG: domain containing protein [Ferruginibacter sp.]|nr:domain containing protein [Ferruginibacter sp.]
MNICSKIVACLSFVMTAFLCTFSSSAQMQFTENKGQWHSNVQYRGDFNTGSFFLENKGFTVLLHNPQDILTLSERTHGHSRQKGFNANEPIVVHSSAYKVDFLGAAKFVPQTPEKPMPGISNYYLGSDPAKWAGGCKIFQAVTYSNVYPNIDIRYYSDAAGSLKYDFIVRPGGNVNAIAMRYDGVKSLSVKDKELIISTAVGEVKELYPYSYQSGDGKRQTVEAKYVVRDNVVSFDIRNYDTKQTLIIDPSIIFSSFTGSTADNWGYTATPGPDGSFYAGGIVFGTGYPVSPGAYDITFGGGENEGEGGYDIGIFKFSPDGGTRLYATYLGGNKNEQPHSMITDPQGNLIVAGRTGSDSFPVTIPKIGPCGKYDIFITKFSADGSRLIGSARIGGTGDDGVNIRPKYTSPLGAESLRRNYGDDARSEVILDGNNNIFLASVTRPNTAANGSQLPSDFPIRNTGIQTSFGGGKQDGVVLKFNPALTNILFSTYFGGNQNDACFVANINPTTGDLYVAGATESSVGLPGLTAGVIQQNFQTGTAGTALAPDGFVTQLKADGSAVVRTTYLSGTPAANGISIDMVYGLKFDRLGFPYVMGTTTGTWPVINAGYSNAGSKQFISKLKPDLTGYVYSTVFGTNSASPNISPIAFMVDRCQNVYVSGWGGGENNSQNYNTGNTTGLPEKNPLAGARLPDGADFYFFVLEKNATSQLFGSHFGQNGGLGDHVDGGTSRFDDNGIIYQAICANCGGNGPQRVTFPTTPGAYSQFNGSSSCNEIALKIEMDFSGVGASVQASINAVVNDTSGCVPLVVTFKDTLQKGKKYYWDFGNGRLDTTTNFNNTNTYTAVGVYRVMLIAEDSSTCNIRDTAYVTIRAGNNKANLDFVSQKLAPCQSLTMQYTNTTTSNTPNFGPKTFIWDYGDGSPRDTSGYAPPRTHTYAAPGVYIVKLIILDTSFCNSPDSIQKTIRLNPIVKAIFETPPTGCAPYTAVFNNLSLAGTDFIWEFGDNTTSTVSSPTHLYATPGIYRVRLIAIDTNTCNRVDTSAYQTIRVVAKPTASFTWAPNPPIANTPVRFTNLSVGATRYLWNFGDGDTSVLTNPTHQYNETGTFRAELVAYNAEGCTDTASLDVQTIINPLLDVPNAFTPGKFGENAIVYVRGFGIGKMNWRIYNRWGQLIFQSASRKSGWDGTFKGQLQPMDVYTYTLDVEFTDGKKIRKTGDITLLK